MSQGPVLSVSVSFPSELQSTTQGGRLQSEPTFQVSLFSLGGPAGRQLALREEYPISQVRATYPAMAAERLLKVDRQRRFP